MNNRETKPEFTLADVEKLADLSRLALTSDEKSAFVKEIGGILAYVGQIQGVTGGADITAHRTDSKNYLLKNIMREDMTDKGTGEELNIDSIVLIDSAPDHTPEHIKVKKILGGSQ